MQPAWRGALEDRARRGHAALADAPGMALSDAETCGAGTRVQPARRGAAERRARRGRAGLPSFSRVPGVVALIAVFVSALGSGCRATKVTHSPETDANGAWSKVARVSELCSEGPRAWDVVADGAITRGRCLGKEGSTYHLVDQLVRQPGGEAVRELHLWVDDEGAPRRAQLRTPVFYVDYLWAGGKVSSMLHGDRVEVDIAPDAWLLDDDAVYLHELRLRLGHAGPDLATPLRWFQPDSPQVKTARVRVDGEGSQGISVAVDIDGGDRRLVAEGPTPSALRVRLVVGPGGAPTHAARAAIESFEPALPDALRPTYRLPPGLTVVPVQIPARGEEPMLAGELVSAQTTGPRAPGVVFLSGSGPQDRRGFVPNSAIDIGTHEILDALALAGFIVLRFDDRGVGDSEIGPTVTPGYQPFVSDARRALAFLAARPEVDPKRIIVIGHSEGALTAARLAGETITGRPQRPRGVVLMALAGRNLRDVIIDQVRFTMAGKDAAAIDAAVAEARALHQTIIDGGDLPAAVEPVRDYLRELFEIDPAALLSRAKVPVLALQGAKDFQIDAARDFAPVQTALARRRDGSEARVFDGLDHLFKHEPGTSSVGHYGDLRRRVDPRVIEAIVAWCGERVRSSG